MKLVVFSKDQHDCLGLLTERGVVAITGERFAGFPEQHLPGSTEEFYADALRYMPTLQAAAGLLNRGELSAHFIPENEINLKSPVPKPGKIICVGLNYRRHAAESGSSVPQTPILFSKYLNAVAGPGECVPLPPTAEKYDYEAELVVVMGRTARNVSEDEALSYVLGYCNGNDISARDLQLVTSQWMLGKTLDKFLPMGPYLVTTDEIPDPQNLRIRCWLNDELRQDSQTSDMVFFVRQIISYVSQYIPLESGDVILTGTPEGVILGRQDQRWMQPGDRVTVEIDGLGRLINEMG